MQRSLKAFGVTRTSRPSMTAHEIDAIQNMHFVARVGQALQRGEHASGWTTAALEAINLKLPAATFTYPGCATCKKRVDALSGRCSTAACVSGNALLYKLQCNFIDHSGALESVALFGDVAEALVGMPAERASQLSDDDLERLRCALLWRRFALTWTVQAGALDIRRVREPDWTHECTELQRIANAQ